MSHELRTPLNAVIGYADMMAHRVLGPLGNAAYEGYARDIADSGRHMLSMVQGILDVSALESDVLEMNMRPTDLGGVIAAASADIQGWAEAKKITLTSALPDALPKVYGNADRLRQVAGIVIENAVKYTARGGHVRIAAKSQEPGWVQLDVVDNGAGMSPETVAAVQFPFAQMDNQDHLVRTPDAAERPGRTGPRLNLPLAKLLAEAHGGDLAIESAPGVGTTVSIRLPTAPASKEEEAEDEGRAPPAERTVAKMVGHKEAAGL